MIPLLHFVPPSSLVARYSIFSLAFDIQLGIRYSARYSIFSPARYSAWLDIQPDIRFSDCHLLVIGVRHLLELRLAKIANCSGGYRPPARFAHLSDTRSENAMSKTELDPDLEYDPVFLHSRREAVIIFCLWVMALLWVVPFCYFNGYGGNVDPNTISMIMGVPTWLFWGIFVPWLVADVFTIWFCFCYMKDDDLGEANEGANIEEELAEYQAAHPSSQEGGA